MKKAIKIWYLSTLWLYNLYTRNNVRPDKIQKKSTTEDYLLSLDDEP